MIAYGGARLALVLLAVATALPACTSSTARPVARHVAQHVPPLPRSASPSPTASASPCIPAGDHPADTRTWVTASGPPAFASTNVEYRSVSVNAEWVGGTSSAPRLDGTDLSGQVRCGLAVLADLGRVPLGVLPPGAQEYRPQRAIRVSATRDSLTLTFAPGAKPQRLEFRPGTPATYLERVGQLRRAAGLPPLDSGLARRVLAHAGFTLDGDMSPWVEPQFPSAFRAVHGTCTGSGDGACQHMFFFYGNRYLGTDAQNTHPGVFAAWQSRDVIALAYPIWRAQDSMCCPRGGVRVVRFEWNGSRVVPLDPIPAEL